ncbi:phosphoribosyltransferase [Legionella londiniensis]|uniref:Phosphoribosyltransferase n=1 Tax=Legionella londiniensis TaxID=45068 RepID=A0A0W0VII2_9GAMM|nr:phosphoribosyltransferase [Legionella londiniensis]KTD19925.1 phosphoribosyltransferase [Legionella londiniensis]STX94202.1 phosphoribosyltransferase [Legionella londiniensis]
MDKYIDRHDAGKKLAKFLSAYKNKPDTIALALPRGGVPVAYEIAKALLIPMDVFIVRKLGVPGHEELAMGAIASGGVTYYNDEIVSQLNLSPGAISEVIASEEKELKRREENYRGENPFPDLKGKTVILIDDGIATGATTRAAIKALKKQNPKRIVLAVPVAAASTVAEMAKEVDEIICPLKPINFYAVGLWYDNFSQTTDEEVAVLLGKQNGKYTD